MKKILLCLFALLLLCSCAKTPQSTSAPLAAEAVLPDSAKIMSVKPSYDTKYYARTMPRVMESDALQAFCEAYTKVLSAAQETAKDLPEGDEYQFAIVISDDGIHRKTLRLVDAGETVYLELTEKKADWILTYTATKEQAQPLLAYFADEPLGKPHIEGHPNGRMISLAERVEKGWPVFEGTVTAVSEEVKEFSLNEGLRYGWLYREFTVEVAECYYGDLLKGTKVTYRVFGGENDDYSFSVENAPQIQVGDYVVIAAPEHSFATSQNLFPATAEERTISGHVFTCHTFTPPVGFFPDSYGSAEKTYDTYMLTLNINSAQGALREYRKHLDDLPEQITEREVAELRLSYPRIGSLFSPLASRHYCRDWSDVNQLAIDSLVTLDFTGEYLLLGSKDDGYPIYEAHVRDYPFAEGICVLFARVEEVFHGCEGVRVGDLVPVLFSSMSDELFRQTLAGQHFLCLTKKIPSRDEGGNYALSNAMQTGAIDMFYLTETNVVLYAGESGDSILDNCSGMYLDSFTELIREKLFSGD